MNFSEAKSEVKQLLSRVDPSDLPRLINWIRESGEPPGPQNRSCIPVLPSQCSAKHHIFKETGFQWPENPVDYRLDLHPADELDELLSDNRRTILQNIADDLRGRVPPDAMFPSESTVHSKVMHRSAGVAQQYFCRPMTAFPL